MNAVASAPFCPVTTASAYTHPATHPGVNEGHDTNHASVLPAKLSAVDALLCVGISYRTAPLALRERLFLEAARVAALLTRFAAQRNDAATGRAGELVVLSTCNRLELYALGEPQDNTLRMLIVEATGVSAAELAPALYEHRGADVVHHLGRVAAGLESMVVGEPQILEQVSDAYGAALAHGAAAHGLETLFRSAVRTGRRVRTETGLGRQAATVSSLAVRVAADLLPELSNASTLVIGAGEMGEHALAALHYHGIRNLCIVSRTHANAKRLAGRFGARTLSLDELPGALAAADLVVCAAAVPKPVVTSTMVISAMISRATRPLLLLDVGVPRNVAPDVGTIPSVRYYDLDELHTAAAHGRMVHSAVHPHAQAIVAAEAEHSVAELRRLDVQPLIAEWRAQAEGIRDTLLRKTLCRFGHLSGEDRTSIEAFSQALVNRILHTPTARMRAAAEDGKSAGYALAVRHLFGLDT